MKINSWVGRFLQKAEHCWLGHPPPQSQYQAEPGLSRPKIDLFQDPKASLIDPVHVLKNDRGRRQVGK